MATNQQVNRPTDTKMKEKDVNQKLQIYGILSAFQSGKVPSNDQIDVALNSFLNKKFMTNPSKKLSSEGQQLVHDFRNVVEQAKVLLLTKNQGNLLQDFAWQTQNLDGGNAAAPNAPVDKETAKQHGNQAADGIRTLGQLIISNGQFRKLLSDMTILAREMVADAAGNAASKVAPTEEQRAQIDRPADDNTWHDTPKAGDLKNQLKQTVDKNAPVRRDDLRDATNNATSTANPTGSNDPKEAARIAAENKAQGGNTGTNPTQGIKEGINTVRDRANQNVDDETKERMRREKEAQKQKARNYMNSKMPQERREQTIWRLKKMIVEIQGHQDYNQAITTLLDLAENYAGHSRNVANQAAGSAKGAHKDTNLKQAERDLRELIERFANYTSTQDLFDSINELYRDADRDPELKDWFKRANRYMRKCLQEQGFILEDRANDEWNQIYDHGRFLLRDRYRNHTDRLVDEVNFLVGQFNEDRQNRAFGDACEKLFNDLGNDENGKPTFKPHLVKDLRDIILPSVFEQIRYVPIPRIEYQDPQMDAVIENLVIEGDNLMPNAVELASDNYFRWGRKTVTNKNKNSVMISVSGVQCDLRDVSYYVKKKQGFPSITDQGVMDILLYGSGLSFKIKVSTADKTDRQNFFKVDKVDVDVKNFNIKFKSSQHKMLLKLFKGFVVKAVRPAIQKALEKVIKDKFNEFDRFAYSIKQEVDKAEEQVKRDPSQAKNIYSRYASAIQKKATEKKKKAEKVTADKKMNVAQTQHDSIFPNVKLEGGISSKATEYRELAKKGDKWESPIFSIGSASKTNNLPQVEQVRRKEHRVTQGGIRGHDNVGQTQPISQQQRDQQAQYAGQQGSGYQQQQGNGNGYGAGHPLQGTTAGLGQNQNGGQYQNGNQNQYSNGGAQNFGGQVDQAFKSQGHGGDNNGTYLGGNNPVMNQDPNVQTQRY